MTAESGLTPKVAARILIVEDEQIVARDIQGILRQLGYTPVGIAASGEEAIELAQATKPDLVLMDIVLTKGTIDGVETVARLRDLLDIPVIYVTSHSDEATLSRARITQPYGYILKPIHTRELQVTIEMSLYRHAMEKQIHEDAQARAEELSKRIEVVEQAKRLLERYFPENLVDYLVDERHQTELEGKNVQATMLFCDVRNSTGIAEDLGPHEFAGFLSELFTGLMDLTYANGGSVNKLMGDGLLITFGCPFSEEADTLNCVRLALQIREYIRAFNESRSVKLISPVAVGIGISTGIVFAGNVGSPRRMEYTVLGDPVNTASRLETLTKTTGHDILIDLITSNLVRAEIGIESVGAFQIRGKKESQEVFFPVGMI